jgi:hypothetical protein
VRPPGAEEADQDITRDVKAFTAAVRTRIFAFLRALVRLEFENALAAFEEEASAGESANGKAADSRQWTPESLRETIEKYRLDHGQIRLDPEARNIRHTYITPSKDKKSWHVEQVLVDPDDNNDWIVGLEIDLEASSIAGVPNIRLIRIGPIEG